MNYVYPKFHLNRFSRYGVIFELFFLSPQLDGYPKENHDKPSWAISIHTIPATFKTSSVQWGGPSYNASSDSWSKFK